MTDKLLDNILKVAFPTGNGYKISFEGQNNGLMVSLENTQQDTIVEHLITNEELKYSRPTVLPGILTDYLDDMWKTMDEAPASVVVSLAAGTTLQGEVVSNTLQTMLSSKKYTIGSRFLSRVADKALNWASITLEFDADDYTALPRNKKYDTLIISPEGYEKFALRKATLLEVHSTEEGKRRVILAFKGVVFTNPVEEEPFAEFIRYKLNTIHV